MNAPLDGVVWDRETRLTSHAWNGTITQRWGDPEETDWEDFEIGPEPDEHGGEDEILNPPAMARRTEIRSDAPAGLGRERIDPPSGPPRKPDIPPPEKGAGKPSAPLSVRMADVEPEEVEWLWEPYIPRGKLTSLEGDPGVGKSWLTAALAAEVSRGGTLPGMKGRMEPATVLLVAAEDGAGDTIRPRLDKLGADVARVHLIDTILSLDLAGAKKLKAEIERLGTVLVIIDPIVAYLPDKTDINSASAIRPILVRLAEIARDTGAAIVFVRHLAKGGRDKAIYRGLGSIDFTAAVRSALMVGFDPSDANKRVVAHAKSNLAAAGPSHAYTLKGGGFAWAGRSSLSAEDLNGPPPNADVRGAREEAREFLLQTLADGPKPALDVQAEAAKLNISTASLRRAKDDLGIKPKEGDHWVWRLPSAQCDSEEEDREDAQAAGA